MEPLTTQCSATKTAPGENAEEPVTERQAHSRSRLKPPSRRPSCYQEGAPQPRPLHGPSRKMSDETVNSREFRNEPKFKNALSVVSSFAEPHIELWRRGGARAGVPLLGGRRSSPFLLGGES